MTAHVTQVSTGSPAPVGLQWTIKRSFLAYVARSPGGRAGVSDGATATYQNEVLFPFDPSVPPRIRASETFLAFAGAITFVAHAGMLWVRIADPWVNITGDRGSLTVQYPETPDSQARIEFASFTVAAHEEFDGQERWTAEQVQLLSSGLTVFGDVYEAGEALEPFTMTVPRPG